MFKKILLPLLLSVTVSKVFAQPKSFSSKPEVFIEELTDYIKSSNRPQNTEIVKEFQLRWNEGIYASDEQRIVIKTCNMMLINLHDIEDFVLFEETLLAGKDSVEADKYYNWLKAILPAAKLGKNTLLTLLKASRNLFKYNMIYSSEIKKWYCEGGTYKFEFNKTRVRILFSDVTLICRVQSDELVVYNTSGYYVLDEDYWEGQNGKVGWERVGFGIDNIYAEILGNYNIQFDRAELNVDTVRYTNTDFLGSSLLGTYRDRASDAKNLTPEQLQKSQFPQFTAFRTDLELGSYLEGQVKFKGGFSMKGHEILARGTAEHPSTVEIYYKDKKKVVARAINFSLKENKITSLNSEVIILTDSGSIYHPHLNFNLNLELKLLLMTRGKEGLEQAPFFDDDHRVEIYVDQVLWHLDQPRIEFDMESNESAAYVESNDFFKDIQYEKITRGMMIYHPLEKMRKFVLTYRTREFTFAEYADWMGSKEVYLKPQIIQLADLGYLYYNPDTDSIKVKRKLDHAVLSHKALKDYDVIRLRSVIAARPNAHLSLINNILTVEGVRAFRFSDSQSVYAFPYEQIVEIHSNRRMKFGGKVTAGKFDFYAMDFEFDYYNFDITSDQIDSMRIYTRDLDGSNNLVAVKSVLRDINGTLEIDNKLNKSGLKDYPDYPKFTSRKGAKIAYDKPNLYGGAYHKDVFYFEVDPFHIDSLDNFTTEGLSFPGTFVAADIIPDFRYEAKIMDDYSLGFERRSPPEGYPMYGGIGHGDLDIKLSESGFEAKGTIEYAGAEISSTDIVLLPDSTLANAESYSIRENEIYPNVMAADVMTKWYPHSDTLLVNTNGHTVDVLRDRQQFTGNLIQTSKELAGNGYLEWETAKLTSSDMKYKPNMVNAEKSKIEIGAIDDDRIAFASYNVNSHVDFNTRIGEFKANEHGQLTQFPFNAYASSMDEYTWDMNAQTITLDKGPHLTKEQSYFITQRSDQQGLKFQSDKAVFDMKEGVIYADNVPYIDVADSRAFPFEGDVVIEENAKMRTLEQARLLASRDNIYHEIYDASLNIHGRYALGGEGLYVFKDKHLTGQIIEMKDLKVRNDSTVYAEGYIRDTLNFTVSPKIAYKGKAFLSSQEEHIRFDGYVKPLHSFTQYPSDWFRYEQQPNPAEVIIPANAHDLRNPDRRYIYATVSVANDSTHVYPTMFNYKRSYADLELTNDTGVLYYNEVEQTFYVGDSAKLFDGSPKGSYLSFNDATGTVYSEGPINFGLNIDENFNGKTAGTVQRSPSDTSFVIDIMMALNMNLPKECFDRMIDVINTNGSGNPAAEHDNTFTTHAVSEFVDGKNFDKALEFQAQGKIQPVGDLNASILISHMQLYYSPARSAFIGLEPIQIASINGTQINKTLTAKVQIIKKRSGTRISIYLEVSKYDWFYFEYYNGSLIVYSTDKQFNDLIIEKGPKLSKGRFRIRTASPRAVTRFLARLEPEEY